MIWGPFCFLAGILFFKILSKFVQTVHTNFHSKSGLCSSRNEPVMLNFFIWRPFCFLVAILFFKILSIRTSMQNLDSVGQKMSELCSILWFGGHFVFQNFVKKWVSYAQFCNLAAILFFKFLSKFVQIVHTNLGTSY